MAQKQHRVKCNSHPFFANKVLLKCNHCFHLYIVHATQTTRPTKPKMWSWPLIDWSRSKEMVLRSSCSSSPIWVTTGSTYFCCALATSVGQRGLVGYLGGKADRNQLSLRVLVREWSCRLAEIWKHLHLLAQSPCGIDPWRFVSASTAVLFILLTLTVCLCGVHVENLQESVLILLSLSLASNSGH